MEILSPAAPKPSAPVIVAPTAYDHTSESTEAVESPSDAYDAIPPYLSYAVPTVSIWASIASVIGMIVMMLLPE